MRLIIFFSLILMTLFTINAEDSSWPYTSSYWENVTLEELEKVIENDININAMDRNGYTALLYAAGLSDNPEIITLLIEKEGEIEKQAGKQWTPLMF